MKVTHSIPHSSAFPEDTPDVVRVGASSTFGLKYVSSWLNCFSIENPSHHIKLIYIDSFKDLNPLSDMVDIAIRPGKINSKLLTQKKLTSLSQTVVVGSNYQGNPNLIDPKELEDEPCIIRKSASKSELWTFVGIDRQSIRIKPREYLTESQPNTIKILVMEGHGFSILPRWFCQEEINQGLLQEVLTDYKVNTTLNTQLYISYKTESKMLPSLLPFTRYIENLFQTHPPF